MNDLLRDFKSFFVRSTALNKLIIINCVAFVVAQLIELAFFLSGSDEVIESFIRTWLSMPADVMKLLLKPWTLFTYMFLHQGLFHILFNMIMLYWTGSIFMDFFGEKKLVALYLLGGVAGAFLYLLAYNVFPVFESHSGSVLIGASAAVLAILVAIATYLPDYTVVLILLGPVRLKYIAIVLVLIDLVLIRKENPGGHIAHLGGAIIGFAYARGLRNGVNLGRVFEKILAFGGTAFKPKPRMKVAYKKTNGPRKQTHSSEPDQSRIDAILDKISRSGYESLTKEEKDILFKVSKKMD